MSLKKLIKKSSKDKEKKPVLKDEKGKKISKKDFRKNLLQASKDKEKTVKVEIDFKELKKKYGKVLTATSLSQVISKYVLKDELTGKNLRNYLRLRYGGTIDEDSNFAIGGRYQFDLSEEEDKDEVKAILKHYKVMARKNA